MDLLLLDELRGHVEFGCDALWDRFDVDTFDHLSTQATAMGLHDGYRWTDWPQIACESNVLSFLEHVFHELSPFIPAELTTYRFIPSGRVPLRNGDCPRKTDLVFATTFGSVRNPFPSSSDAAPSWADVRVIGELKANPEKSDNDSTVVQVANYVREVFGNQPGRRWVMCFTLCGKELRIWQFDRGGAVGSTIINIDVEWKLFLRTFFSFATLDPTSAGFDPTIRCVMHGWEDTFDPTLAAYSPEPSMAKRWAIITRTGLCSRARLWGTEDWTYVVKDQWRAPERGPEGDLIRQCSCLDASGLPRCIWHGDIRVFQNGIPAGEGIPSLGIPAREDIASLRPRSAGPGATRPAALTALHLRKVSGNSHYLLRAGCHVQNRVHSRLLISPAGISLNRFSSYSNLLTALRDAISSQRHMFYAHQILHRDVSVNNVILCTPLSGPAAGVLIDFDLAISTTRTTTSGATQRTGTFDFMAHEILENPQTPHTPLHDLESFFYVLLWLAIHYDRSGGRRDPP
ncbi:hypothetical protein FN846DRAFT_765161, partial [Sphaerosporella brunnea]